MTEVIA